MAHFLQTLISGLSLGSIYALIALGYTMVYGIAKMLNFRIVHIGINNDNESNAEEQVERFEVLFGFKRSPKTNSIFASDEIEVCKKRFPGVHGHLAVGTGNCERAMFYLSKKGMTFDMDTAKYKGERVSSIYLTEQIGGFAIHLVEK